MKPLIILMAALISAPVAAQTQNCAPRETLISRLAHVGEIQTGMGLATKKSLIEIWTSDKTGTWTVVMTFTSGMSCVMAFGEGWTVPETPELSQVAEPA